MRHKLLMGAALLLLGACAPKLGAECENAFECSANSTRFCDRSQPGGYCTIADCEPNGCAGEGYCVRFFPNEPRRSRDWCMAECDNDGDCRDSYECRGAKELNDRLGATLAEVLDEKKGGKFCVVRE